MASLSRQRTVTLIKLACFLYFVRFQPVSGTNGESGSHSVEIKIYDTDTSSWNRTALRDTVLGFTTYCNSHLSICGLNSATTFALSDVVSSSPTKDGSSIVASVYILFPSGASVNPNGSTQFVVPYTATKEIISLARSAYHDNTGLWMTYIGGQYYSIPPDADVNEVVVPLTFVTVFLTGITAAVLSYHEKRKEKNDKLERKMAEKKRSGATSHHHLPNYNILETTNTTVLSNTPRASNNSKMTLEERSNNISWNLNKSALVSKSVTSFTKATSPNEFHDDAPIRKNGLKPLERDTEVDAEETDAEKKERRRRRKERKLEKRRLRDLEVYDNHGLDSSNMSENDNDRSKVAVQTFSVERNSTA